MRPPTRPLIGKPQLTDKRPLSQANPRHDATCLQKVAETLGFYAVKRSKFPPYDPASALDFGATGEGWA
jgi:hypothetical protein